MQMGELTSMATVPIRDPDIVAPAPVTNERDGPTIRREPGLAIERGARSDSPGPAPSDRKSVQITD